MRTGLKALKTLTNTSHLHQHREQDRFLAEPTLPKARLLVKHVQQAASLKESQAARRKLLQHLSTIASLLKMVKVKERRGPRASLRPRVTRYMVLCDQSA